MISNDRKYSSRVILVTLLNTAHYGESLLLDLRVIKLDCTLEAPKFVTNRRSELLDRHLLL